MVLVATRKGLFEIESDNRKDWTTRGPFCESWPLYHAIYDQVSPRSELRQTEQPSHSLAAAAKIVPESWS